MISGLVLLQNGFLWDVFFFLKVQGVKLARAVWKKEDVSVCQEKEDVNHNLFLFLTENYIWWNGF